MGFQDLDNVACIHGRFQPFHLGHVDYLKAALSRWQHILIGIAAPTPVKLSFPGVEHRNLPSSNPLTYVERTILIRQCCRELGIPDQRIEFTPFPIDEPATLPHLLPKTVVCATTRLYDWNEEKIRRLSNEGYTVHVLEKCEKAPFDGNTIRLLIRKGDPSWKTMVTPAVADILESWRIRRRLESLHALNDECS